MMQDRPAEHHCGTRGEDGPGQSNSRPQDLNWEMLSMGQQEADTRSMYSEKLQKVMVRRSQSHV